MEIEEMGIVSLNIIIVSSKVYRLAVGRHLPHGPVCGERRATFVHLRFGDGPEAELGHELVEAQVLRHMQLPGR